MSGYYSYPKIIPDMRKCFPTDDPDLPDDKRRALYAGHIRALRRRRFPCGWNGDAKYCLTLNCKKESGPCNRWEELMKDAIREKIAR